ncbi:MAG: hypothetical protein JW856_02715 [Dehalococcoidales bacterium]|nr:hypothetical protein [Dehalococcoidales bacterium]
MIANYISTVFYYSNTYDYVSEALWDIILLWGIAAFLMILLVLTGFLWWKTDRVVKIIAGNIPESEVSVTTSNSELLRTLMRFLGVCIIVLNIPPVVRVFAYYFATVNTTGGTFPIESLIEEIVTILLGIWLVVGNKGIMKAYRGVKDYIQPPIDEGDKKEDGKSS